MGTYINPGYNAFLEINNDDFVDKTMLIDLINKTIRKKDKKLTCVSRPRRFGKSYAARMLVAYYDCSCNSEALFNDKKIAQTKLYKDHMYQYNIIRLDISEFTSTAIREGTPLHDVANTIVNTLHEELLEMEPDCSNKLSLKDLMLHSATKQGGKQFIFIIDEWDAVIREARHDAEAQDRFLSLLREWFKNEAFTPYVVAAAYMTGILPIKKNERQTTFDFNEYSMLYPGAYAPYLGFDEEEVKVICNTYNLDFTRIKQWYDGYTLGPMHSVYNPYSVMSAAHETHRRYRSYWKKTSAAEALKTYIDMDLDGLQDTIVKLIVGESVEVNTSLFKNDMETFSSKDDVLTLLIHLGYLSFEFTNDDEESEIGLARIPNKEVKIEFEGILRTARHKNLVNLVRTSDKLLQDVMTGKEDAVAKEIHDVHDSHYAPTFYNHEQSLRSVIRLACISWVDQYAKVEELPSGHGIADVVFFPKRRSPLPAVIVELKWDKDQEGAIKQIKDRKYQKTLEQLEGEIILVGVNYDSQDKTHTCKIERIQIT